MASNPKAPKGTRRAEKKKLWESHKEEIHRVYMTENKTLPETIQILSAKHGINASIRTWKTKLKEWKYDKYSTKDVVEGVSPPENGSVERDDEDAPHNAYASLSPQSTEPIVRKRKIMDADFEPKRIKVTDICDDSDCGPYVTPSESVTVTNADETMSEGFSPRSRDTHLDSLPYGISSPDQIHPFPPEFVVKEKDLHIRSRYPSEQPVVSLNMSLNRLSVTEKRPEDRVTAEESKSTADSQRDNGLWKEAISSYLLAIEKYKAREGDQAAVSIANIRSDLAAIYERSGRLDDSMSVHRLMMGEYRTELRNPDASSRELTDILAETLSRRTKFDTRLGLLQKSGFLIDRLDCLHRAANIFEEHEFWDEALRVLHVGLVDYLENGHILGRNVGNTIIISLLKAYPRFHNDPAWFDLTYKLSRLQKAIENAPSNHKWDRLLITVRIMELAECYSLVQEFDTSEMLFMYCKERLMYAPGLWGARKASFFHNYARHNLRQEKWTDCTLNLISALQQLADLSLPDSGRGKAIRNEMSETRMEVIGAGGSSSGHRYGDEEEDRQNIRALISWTEWLLNHPSEEQQRNKRGSAIRSIRRLKNQSRTMTWSTRTSSISSASIGMTYSDADFDGFDVAEMSAMKRNHTKWDEEEEDLEDMDILEEAP